MIYCDEKAQKLSSQFATYLNKINFVPAVQQSVAGTEMLLRQLEAKATMGMGINIRYVTPPTAQQATGTEVQAVKADVAQTRQAYGVHY